MQFPVWLRTEMDRQGLSVTELARLLGVHHGMVSAWRNGRRKPKADNVRAIANAIAWEAEGDDEMAASSRKTAAKLHEMADNHEAMGKTDPRNDPMGIVGPEARPR